MGDRQRELGSSADSNLGSGMADIFIDNVSKEGNFLEKYPMIKFDVVVVVVVVEMS